LYDFILGLWPIIFGDSEWWTLKKKKKKKKKKQIGINHAQEGIGLGRQPAGQV
jgi:hypothetical protein